MIGGLIRYLMPVAIIAGVSYCSLLSFLDLNPISIAQKEAKLIFTLAPQGWGFFTRSPRELQTLIYIKKNAKYELVNKSGSDPEYLFGLSRYSRRKNIELGQIFSTLPDSIWSVCPTREIFDCDSGKVFSVKNVYKNSACFGDYLLILSEPIPWAWAKSYNRITMPFKYCKIRVEKTY